MIPDKIVLNKNELNNIDMMSYEKYLMPKVKRYFFRICGEEHYRLLAHLSKLYSDSNLLDVGTHMGASALALSHNQSNTVNTIDIVNKVEYDLSDIKNINFHIGDVFENDSQLIKDADLILYDTTHSGELETKFHNHLLDINWKGICIWDDTKYGYTGNVRHEMVKFWNSIKERKIDITEYAHWTGTGIVFYNCDPEVNLK